MQGHGPSLTGFACGATPRPHARGTIGEPKCAGVLRLITAFLVAVTVGTLPAQAQGVTPTSSVEVDLEPGPVGIPLGGSHEFPFQVTLELGNIACPQPSTATVTLSIKDLPSPLRGVQGTVPATLAFDVPMSASFAGLSTYRQTLDAQLSINVTPESLPDHEHTFEVTASFDGTLPGCQAAGAIPTAQGTSEHKIKTGPASAVGTQVRGASQSPSSSGAAGDGKDAPALPALALAVAVAVLAAAVARRRA